MTRCVLFLSAALLVLPLAPRAQTTADTPTSASQSQLDRIESKLDAALRRLDQLQRPPPGAVQGHPVSSGASSASPVSGEPPAPPPAAYKPGALVVARPALKDANSLAEVPADGACSPLRTWAPRSCHCRYVPHTALPYDLACPDAHSTTVLTPR